MRPISKCFCTFLMKHSNSIQYHIERCIIRFVTSLHSLIKERNILIGINFLIYYREYGAVWPGSGLFREQRLFRRCGVPSIDIKKNLIDLCFIQLNLI